MTFNGGAYFAIASCDLIRNHRRGPISRIKWCFVFRGNRSAVTTASLLLQRPQGSHFYGKNLLWGTAFKASKTHSDRVTRTVVASDLVTSHKDMLVRQRYCLRSKQILMLHSILSMPNWFSMSKRRHPVRLCSTRLPGDAHFPTPLRWIVDFQSRRLNASVGVWLNGLFWLWNKLYLME